MSNQRHLSHTQVSMYMRCPKQYEFRYIQNIILPPTAALTKGRLVHVGAEYNLRQKVHSREDLPEEQVLEHTGDEFEKAAQETDWRPDEIPGQEKDKVLRMVQAYLRSLAPEIQPVEVEAKIAGYLGDLIYTGVIDVIDNHGRIRDLKTSRRAPAKDIAENNLQLIGYAALVSDASELLHDVPMGEGPVPVALDYVIDGKEVRTRTYTGEVTEASVDWFIDTIRAVAEGINQGIFYRNTTNYLCNERWCGYWHQCKKGGSRHEH